MAVGVVERDPESVMLRFEVRDSGIGIPSDRLHTLFKPFSQVNASTTRRFGGTGLGLSIVKRLAEMMGGEAGVVSHDGVGSTFWFSARFGIDATAAGPVTSATHAAPDGSARPHLGWLKGRRVLAVDDHETNRKVIKSQLEQYEIDIVCTATADDAWRELLAASEAGRPFDAALIDRHPPDCDGAEFGQCVAQHGALKATRLILLTSSGNGGAGARAERVAGGCRTYDPRGGG